MSGHTKGVWCVRSMSRHIDVVSDDDLVCEVMSSRPREDARLIAAAPMLLEALKGALEHASWTHSRECHPSEDVHTEGCRLRKAALEKSRAAVRAAEVTP